MSTLLWMLAVALGAGLVLQAVVLRTAYRRKAAMLHARHLQSQQTLSDKLDKAKRQVGQLQNDLAAARRQIVQLGKDSVASVQGSVSPRQLLERELDAAPAERYTQSAEGFADTQPAPMVTQHGSLLFQ
jgi:hypothetical protein